LLWTIGKRASTQVRNNAKRAKDLEYRSRKRATRTGAYRPLEGWLTIHSKFSISRLLPARYGLPLSVVGPCVEQFAGMRSAYAVPTAPTFCGLGALLQNSLVSDNETELMRTDPFVPFHDIHLLALIRDVTERLERHVASEDAAHLAGANPSEYSAAIASQFALSTLDLDLEARSATQREEQAREAQFNIYAGRSAGDVYTRQVITVHVPFRGDSSLFRCFGNSRTICSRPIWLDGGELCLDVIVLTQPNTDIKGEVGRMLSCLAANAGSLNQEIANFNRSLPALAQRVVDRCRADLQHRMTLLQDLGLPLKPYDTTPRTLAVPVERKVVQAAHPLAGKSPYKQEWMLDTETYEDILRVLHNHGRAWERLPRSYQGKDEETLRDELLVQLEGQFRKASATGETFNKAGKTDILMRHEKHNIFVAECKFWRGRQQHLATIDQLLGYLTWRDSKTAILYFVDNREITAPLRAIEAHTHEHQCFVRAQPSGEESLFHYTFQLPGDSERHLALTILCFHLP
jgi:hypothetical protein